MTDDRFREVRKTGHWVAAAAWWTAEGQQRHEDAYRAMDREDRERAEREQER